MLAFATLMFADDCTEIEQPTAGIADAAFRPPFELAGRSHAARRDRKLLIEAVMFLTKHQQEDSGIWMLDQAIKLFDIETHPGTSANPISAGLFIFPGRGGNPDYFCVVKRGITAAFVQNLDMGLKLVLSFTPPGFFHGSPPKGAVPTSFGDAISPEAQSGCWGKVS